MTLTVLLLIAVAVAMAVAVVFTCESVREQEPRAPKVGGAAILLLLLSSGLIVFAPQSRIPIAVGVLLVLLFGLALLVPGSPRARSLEGSMGYAVEEIKRFDQRDTIFGRNMLPPDSEVYRQYYEAHPEWEAHDAERRARGGALGTLGAIDRQYRPNVEMMKMNFQISTALAPHASGFQLPGVAGTLITGNRDNKPIREKMDPAEATKIIKGYAARLGADLVGICKVDPSWAYSHKAYSHEGLKAWGDRVPDQLPYAVVFATEMLHKHVMTSPHTPAEVECAHNYAKGAIISTALAQWFAGMGYRAKAHHNRSYDLIMPPLAVDAGLGELGRFGYVITDRVGARARVFACTTDMPLIPDEPIDLGAEEFCERCLKCAEACPSRSIPSGDKVVFNGVKKWKLNEQTCFDYWGKIGTGCSICMAICPFSRPNRSIHRIVRWFLKRSPLARRIFPHVDNFVYGTKWRPRRASDWLSYPEGPRHVPEGRPA